jgi:TRAP-type C4-dicarboxylate transport system substrate-binding protein
MHPWAKRINEQGKGVLAIDVRDGPTLANFNNYYDRVISNTVQISWGIQSYIAGKFAASLAPGLPFTSDKAEDASVAYWRLLKSGILDSEYTDIEPLFFCVFSQASLHTRRPVARVDDLAGMKIATGNSVAADLVTRMKGVPISLALTEYYEALQRGTVDGVVTPWTAILPFKLHEVVRHHIELPLGATTGALFMARKRFAELTPAARKLLVDNSGEAESRRFGAFWDSEQDRGRNIVKSMAGHTVANASAEQEARLRELVQPVKQAWTAKTPNGAKALDAYEKLLAEVRSGRS